ncbi:MAG: 1-acyl-sn-glycerol-3-phosphate acyltransferase [Rhizobiaceae bacterium]|nr:1-acyl-sn-glycerol-3-phosphate acyltransferase [Rhizobiaceae bacterium]
MKNSPKNKNTVRVIDNIFGKLLRHLVFALVRPYFSVAFNVSCSNKEKLQGLEGAIILSNHVSRHDPPLILATLYAVTRIRPTAYYREYEHWLQKYPMMLFGTIPMSSPKTWAPERREANKLETLDIMRRVVENGNSILIFPAGNIRKGEKEEIAPYLTGAYDTIKALGNPPVVLLKLDGLGKYQYRKYDLFWSFLGIKKGRRHVKIDLQIVENLTLGKNSEAFNKKLEKYFNGGPVPK